jgi:hypothetical protein
VFLGRLLKRKDPFATEFIVSDATLHDESRLFVAFETSTDELKADTASLGFNRDILSLKVCNALFLAIQCRYIQAISSGEE